MIVQIDISILQMRVSRTIFGSVGVLHSEVTSVYTLGYVPVILLLVSRPGVVESFFFSRFIDRLFLCFLFIIFFLLFLLDSVFFLCFIFCLIFFEFLGRRFIYRSLCIDDVSEQIQLSQIFSK